MPRVPDYPFEPRSNAYLRAGQFWAIPLSDGRFACGRVLASLRDSSDPFLVSGTRVLLAGLMDWVGSDVPTSDDLAGASLVAQGMAHIKAIQRTGGAILGYRDLALDDIGGLREVTPRGRGVVYLYEGARRLRPATSEEATTLPILSAWGFKVIEDIAESRFVSGK